MVPNDRLVATARPADDPPVASDLAALDSAPARLMVAKQTRDAAAEVGSRILAVVAESAAEPWQPDLSAMLGVFDGSGRPNLEAIDAIREQQEASRRMMGEIAPQAAAFEARFAEVVHAYQRTAWVFAVSVLLAACAGIAVGRRRHLGLMALPVAAMLPSWVADGWAPLLLAAPLSLACAICAARAASRQAPTQRMRDA